MIRGFRRRGLNIRAEAPQASRRIVVAAPLLLLPGAPALASGVAHEAADASCGGAGAPAAAPWPLQRRRMLEGPLLTVGSDYDRRARWRGWGGGRDGWGLGGR
jgi:hypothetical protein